LIALGSGGIKPCVASFVGDQFDQTNKHRAKVVFDAFYWIINFGSLFASALMPIFLRSLGPAIAFGIPGVLMFISTFVLWIARKQYVMLPPSEPNPHSFLNVCRTALASGTGGRDDEAELVSVVADAGAQSCLGDVAHSLQQPCTLSGAPADRIRSHGAPTNDGGDRVCRNVLDRRRWNASGAQRRQRLLDRLA